MTSSTLDIVQSKIIRQHHLTFTTIKDLCCQIYHPDMVDCCCITLTIFLFQYRNVVLLTLAADMMGAFLIDRALEFLFGTSRIRTYQLGSLAPLQLTPKGCCNDVCDTSQQGSVAGCANCLNLLNDFLRLLFGDWFWSFFNILCRNRVNHSLYNSHVLNLNNL